MTARAGWLPRVDPDALDARQRLDSALVLLSDEGKMPPCHRDSRPWFSDEATEIRAAIAGCLRCPVLAPCGDYAVADEITDRYGVWGALPDPEQRDALRRAGGSDD